MRPRPCYFCHWPIRWWQLAVTILTAPHAQREAVGQEAHRSCYREETGCF